MKGSRLVLAVVAVGLASCSSPTAPRLPQPDEGRDPPPDKPGVVAFQAFERSAGGILQA